MSIATSSTTSCAHCGLPVRGEQGDDGTEPRFCCRGCKGAYELIRGWGLEEFYDLRDVPGDEIPDETSRSFDDLDDPRLMGRSAPLALQSGSDERLLMSTLAISGLHCAACVWLIERAPERVPGWQSARVNMHARTVRVVLDPAVIRLSDIARFLFRVGYEVGPLDEQAAADAGADASRALLIDVAVAGFCAANAMWVAIALYAGQFSGIAASHAQFFRFAGVGLGVAAVVFPGRVFFRSAAASLVARTPHMDLPVAVGLTAGLAASLYGLTDPSREVYFDSIACLVFFLLTGRWLQMRGQRRAGEAVAELVRVSPPVATRIEADGGTSRISVDQLQTGDLVLVGPSESVPVDGVVVQGQSLVDRSLLTGESFPVEVSVGSRVEAGTDNTQATLTVRTTAIGDDTRLGAIKNSVAQAAESRTPIVQLANRIGAWFVIIVLILAVVTGALWWWIDPSRSINHVVALLIVACPCALALATPLAIAVSIGRLAKRNVLVRSGDCLERLASPGTIFFDKTGTLTEGRMRVTHWHGSPDVLADVALIEATINHPIARAVVQHAAQVSSPADGAACREATEVQHQIGRGVLGTVGGHRYEIGSLRLLADDGVSVDHQRQRQIDELVDHGASPLVVIRDGICEAIFGVVDPLRAEAVEIVRAVRADGWRVEVISGDHTAAVTQVARSLDIDLDRARGDLLPEDKLDAVRHAQLGPTVMVGDGVNDAAALAAADVGIAVRGGARASLAAAPVVIGKGTLQGVLDITAAARQTRRTILRNFAISIGYNVVAVILAMAGWITPLIAAVLMPISSLTVLGLTLATPQVSDADSPSMPPATP